MQEEKNKNTNSSIDATAPLRFFSRVCNIAPYQWSRVTECWLVTFFFKVGAAIGWTVLVASFIAHFGIALLPTLFVINAVFIVLGTLFFEELIMRVQREVLMIQMLLMACLFLFIASFLYSSSPLAFFTLVILAESIFLAQFNVFIPILVGDRFSPLESQRTFPFIESGETIGGIVGGVLTGVFAFHMSIPLFLYIWISALALIILVFIVASARGKSSLPLPMRRACEEERVSKRDELRQMLHGIQRFPFLKGLVMIVLFQWIFMNILEFQYTKAIEQNITGSEEVTIAHLDPKVYQVALLTSPDGVRGIESKALESTRSRTLTAQEQAHLTNKLGTLKSSFHLLALLVQVVVASRLITFLGIVPALLIHPIIMLLSLVGSTLKFGFMSSVIMKGNFELTNVIHKNAYFASHYAFPKSIRDQAAEFLEGIIRPMGTIVGMLGILALQLMFKGSELTLWIHLIMFVIMGGVLAVTLKLQQSYTSITEDQLFAQLPYPEHLNAIEILAQRGHESASLILAKKLREIRSIDRHESEIVQMRLLRSLAQCHDYETLPDIIDSLYAKDPDVRLEAAHALLNFRDVGTQFYTQAFSRYRMVSALKEVFRSEKSSTVRRAIIKVFSLIREPDTVAFLLEVLGTDSADVKADCIYTLGLFRDPTSAYYIRPFLEHRDAKIRASAVIALWQFPSYRSILGHQLATLLSSENTEDITSAIFALGEIGRTKQYRLQKFLSSEKSDIALEAAFALAKNADEHACALILNTYVNAPEDAFKSLERFLRRLDPRTLRMFQSLIINMLDLELRRLRQNSAHATLNDVDRADLERIRRYYSLLDEHEELYALDSVLNKGITS